MIVIKTIKVGRWKLNKLPLHLELIDLSPQDSLLLPVPVCALKIVKLNYSNFFSLQHSSKKVISEFLDQLHHLERQDPRAGVKKRNKIEKRNDSDDKATTNIEITYLFLLYSKKKCLLYFMSLSTYFARTKCSLRIRIPRPRPVRSESRSRPLPGTQERTPCRLTWERESGERARVR